MSVTIFSFSALIRSSFVMRYGDLTPRVGRHASRVLLPRGRWSFKKLGALVAAGGSRGGKNRGGKDEHERAEAQPTAGELSSERRGAPRRRCLGRERRGPG